MLTGILLPGEMSRPLPLEAPSQPWHLNTSPIHDDTREARQVDIELVARISDIRVLYYRPYPWLPALRLETSRAAAETAGRLASLVHAVKHQCGAASIKEPYPLYVADRMVKSLAAAIPTFRQVTSQRMAEAYEGDLSDVLLGLHGYRSESGR
jgi:hypothetical protein